MLQTWHRVVFTDIKQRLLRASMELIRKDREGEHVEKYLVENVRKSFGKPLLFVAISFSYSMIFYS